MTIVHAELTPAAVDGLRAGGSPAQLLRAGDPVALRHELGAEPLRILRARAGRVPLSDTLEAPGSRRAALAVAAALRPIRTRATLRDAYAREAVRSDVVRTGYALTWLDLGHGEPAASRRRARTRRVTLVRGRA